VTTVGKVTSAPAWIRALRSYALRKRAWSTEKKPSKKVQMRIRPFRA